MNVPKFRLISSAAVLALAMTASAHAAVIATFSPITDDSDYSWVRDGSGIGGTLSSVGSNGPSAGCTSCAATWFYFLDPSASSLSPLPATFQLSATTTGPDAFVNSAGIWNQTGLDGNFSFTYWDSTKAFGSTQTIGGFSLVNGETNLLSGTFTGAWIQGSGGSGATNLTVANGGAATFTSAILPHFAPGASEFALNLLSVSPQFHAGAGQSLASFDANGGGNFSAITGSIPEPTVWGLMIVGFGGMGLMLRHRRRAMAATA